MVILPPRADQAGAAAPAQPPRPGGQITFDWPRQGCRGVVRVLGRLGLVVVLVAGGGGVWWWLSTTNSRGVVDSAALQIGPLQVAPLTVEDSTPPTGPAQPGTPSGALSPAGQRAGSGSTTTVMQWAQTTAARTDIPPRVLLGYGLTELRVRAAQPKCHLSWATLAGIGHTESDHGREGGAQILPSGEESRPVIGPTLDGTGGNSAIPATSYGLAWDGDPRFDHAIGPMQFIPSTFAAWATDGNGDGRADPENIDDAVLTAGRYLCAAGRDTATASGLQAAILSYNHSLAYLQTVYRAAAGYAHTAAP